MANGSSSLDGGDPNVLAERFANALRAEDRAWLRKRGLFDSTIRKYRLGYVDSGRYRNSVAIPYLNPDGSVRTIRFRYLSPHKYKYDGFKGHNIHLYNVAHTTSPYIWLCEGEFDSLILTQMGLPAVGIPGSNGFKPDWKYLFINAERINLVFDSDEAGERGANRIASILGDVVLGDLRITRLPSGLDVTDMYLKDPNELRELVT